MDDAVLHEPSHRRPEWSESRGEWITLGDGQQWLVPKPVISLRPMVIGGKMAGRRIATDFGREFNNLRQATNDAIESEDGVGYENGVFALAIMMLGIFYEIADADYEELLDSAKLPDDFLLQVWRVASGQAPKLLTAGDD